MCKRCKDYLALKKIILNFLTNFSGFWGISRHLNYVWELMLALSWSLPGLGSGPWTFMYFIFLVVLLVHRLVFHTAISRDNQMPYIFTYNNKFACLIKENATEYNLKSLDPS